MRRGAAAALALALAACSSDAFSTAPQPVVQASVLSAGSGAPTLLSCPNLQGKSVTRSVGPKGGSLTVAGTKLEIPAGAVRGETRFVMSIPESEHLVLDIVAEGHEHFRFERPVTVRVNYAHCRSEVAEQEALEAWHVDDSTGDLLQFMESHDDKRAKKVTFTTDHLSKYAIAW